MLHVALRMPRERSLIVDGVDVVAEVHEVLDRMAAFADDVRSGEWRGYTGKPIRNVVNIGIGGSDLGPVMAYEALRHYSRREMTFRFVSNVDSTDFAEATRDLEPGRDAVHHLLEDLHDARDDGQRAARPANGSSPRSATRPRSRATSSRSRRTPRQVAKFGIDTANMFGFWDWVGGRYSMDSAIGLSTMLADRARGVRARCWPDSTRWTSTSAAPRSARNLPVLLGLLAVWYGDFFGAQTVGVMPYEQYLKRFPAYLQQLTMESNGKHVTLDGRTASTTRPGRLLGRAGDQRAAQLLPADPPGDEADPCRPHRLRARP